MTTFGAIVSFFLPLLCMFSAGLGFWFIGRWLRDRGHGEKLDRIDSKLTSAQRATERKLGPLAGLLTGFAQSISKAPLIGSKRSREMWRDLDQREEQHRKNRD